MSDEGVQTQHKPHVWLWAALAGVAGGIVGRLFPPFVLDEGFWRSFITSAGFGGVMAVIAAVIAYAAARHSAKSARAQAEEDRKQRKLSDRKEQWWARAEWALNQVVSGDSEIGYRMLNALGESEWADEHEADVIAAATEDALTAVEVIETAEVASEPDAMLEDSTESTGREKMVEKGGSHGD